MDFRGAKDPLIFFGPLRGAANPSNSARGGGGVDPKILENRKGVLEPPLGIPSESPTVLPALNRRQGIAGPWAAGNRWPLGGREALAPGRQGSSGLVISRISRGTPGLRSRFRASSRGFPRKFLDGMAQN